MISCSLSIIIYEHKSYDESKDSILLGLASEWIKGNRSVGELGKVNSAILYRNELDPEKHTIPQELYGQMLPRDQVWMKDKSIHLRDDDT